MISAGLDSMTGEIISRKGDVIKLPVEIHLLRDAKSDLQLVHYKIGQFRVGHFAIFFSFWFRSIFFFELCTWHLCLSF